MRRGREGGRPEFIEYRPAERRALHSQLQRLALDLDDGIPQVITKRVGALGRPRGPVRAAPRPAALQSTARRPARLLAAGPLPGPGRPVPASTALTIRTLAQALLIASLRFTALAVTALAVTALAVTALAAAALAVPA